MINKKKTGALPCFGGDIDRKTLILAPKTTVLGNKRAESPEVIACPGRGVAVNGDGAKTRRLTPLTLFFCPAWLSTFPAVAFEPYLVEYFFLFIENTSFFHGSGCSVHRQFQPECIEIRFCRCIARAVACGTFIRG